jgi:Fe-S oxidoreductase
MDECISIRQDVLPLRYQKVEEKYISDCINCGICISSCPIIPISNLRSAGEEDICESIREDLEKNCVSNVVIDKVFACSRCGICVDLCPFDINIFDLQQALRCQIMAENAIELPSSHVKAKLEIHGRVWNSADIDTAIVSLQTKPGERQWVEEIPQTPEQSDMVLFLGCHCRRYVDKIKLLIHILEAVGLKFVTVGGGKTCCGTPLQCIGKLIEADNQGKTLVSELSRYSPKIVALLCPTCFYRLHSEIPKYCEVPFEVIHVNKLIAERIHNISFSNEVNRKVTFHDPCRLKVCGDYEPARTILKNIPGISLVEMNDHTEQHHCCGGTAWAYHRGYANELREKVLKCAEETEADVLATACLFCYENFREVSDQYPFKIDEVLELLGEAMGIKSENRLERYSKSRDPEDIIEETQEYIDVSNINNEDFYQFIRIFFA